jgi:trans-2-enoyl-CoA reductase
LSYNNAELFNQLLSAFVSFAQVVLPVLALYIIMLLKRMAGENQNRAEVNHQRDHQRDEIQENVRRLVNGHGVQDDPKIRPDDATVPHHVPHVPHAPYHAPQLTARVVAITTDDSAPTEPHSGQKDGA